MAWVTVIGPSAEQVEYRLTGRHGCSQADATLVDAAPLVEAVRAQAAAQGVPADALFGSDRQRALWARVSGQVDARGAAYRMSAANAHRLAEAAGVDAHAVYGEQLRTALDVAADPRLAYRMDVNERPLMWIGQGVREFGFTPGSELTAEQFDAARAVMRGVDPRTGEQLVTPKTAVDPRAKLAGRPLLEAIRHTAARRGVAPLELFDSDRKRAAYGRLERQVRRLGEAHRVKITDVAKLADAAGVDLVELYGAAVVDKAFAHEHDRVVVGNQGYDVTLTLPKPFSVLFAFAQGELAAECEQMFVDALTEAVGAGEGWAAYGMRGHHGDGESAARVDSSGFIGWVNFHRAARPVGDAPYGDPHLHGHVTIANLCRGGDGKWSTIAAGGKDLHRHARAIDAVMQARIRALTRQRWGIEWRRNAESGLWEIVGIPQATVRLFSKRNAEVRKLFAALGIPLGATTTAQQHAAAAKTANAKRDEATTAPDEVLRGYWRAEAAAADQDPDRILADALDPLRVHRRDRDAGVRLPASVEDIDGVARWVFRPEDGLTAHAKTFTRAEAIAAVVDAVRDGIDHQEQAAELTDRVLAHAGYAVRLADRGPRHLSNNQRYTTADIIAAERVIIGQTRARYRSGAGVVGEHTFDLAVATYETTKRAENPDFAQSGEQVAVLSRILRGGHGIDAVIGVAGAGKTTIMEVARIAWEAQGYVVAGASTAAVACANLRMEAGIRSATVAAWLERIEHGRGLRGVDVLVLDEAAMVDDRQLARLLAHAAQTGTKVVGIGDPLQLQSPGVGGAFAAVHTLVGGLHLSTNYRQRDRIEREALRTWRDGDRREALRLWAERGRVHAATNRDEAMAAMVIAWQHKRAGYTDPHDAIAGVLLLAGRNADVEALNIAARAIRRERGELGEHEVTYDLAGGGALSFAVGDAVLVRRNDYRAWQHPDHADVLNGYRGVVVAIDRKRRVQVEWREKTADGGHRLVREWVDADYIARGGLSHGIAMTVHKAQGLTADHALVYGAGLAGDGAYTALSRDRREVHLFLPRDAFEDDATRAALGHPDTPDEELDRVLAGFADAVDTDPDQPLVVTELGERIEAMSRPAPAPGDDLIVTLEHLDDRGEHAEPAAAQPAENPYADLVRVVLADLVDDVEQLLTDDAFPALAATLRAAEHDGHDVVELLFDAATSRPLGDAESVAAVLTWRLRQHRDDHTPDTAAAGARERAADAEQDAAQPAAAAPAAWRTRPFGELTDDELASRIHAIAATVDRADARATRAGTDAALAAAAAAGGDGPAVRAVTAEYHALAERAAAIDQLAGLDRAYQQANHDAQRARTELARLDAQLGSAGRFSGPRRASRPELADRAAALRVELETVTRQLVELDLQRATAARTAGPEASRATAYRRWLELSTDWPRPVHVAQRSDDEDATAAQVRADRLRGQAGAARRQLAALRGEAELRAGLPEDAAVREAVERAAARIADQPAETTSAVRADRYASDDVVREQEQRRDEGLGYD